jgi:hypothetical protein
LNEGAFHLLQGSQLFLGERHGNLPSRGVIGLSGQCKQPPRHPVDSRMKL